MYESALERYIVEKVRLTGGKAYKWVCPGVTGVPDRICVFPGGKIVFVELKRPGLEDGRSVRQKKVCRVLQGLGCDVRRVSDKAEFIKIIKEVMPDDI